MYVVCNRIPVTAGHEEAFEDRFANRASMVDGMPGFVSFSLLRPQTEGDPYVVMTFWESETHFKNWTSSDAFKNQHALEVEALTEANAGLREDGDVDEITVAETPLDAEALWNLLVGHQGEEFGARELAQVIAAVEAPVNALLAGPLRKLSLEELTAMGARRLSLGSQMARVTHAAIHDVMTGVLSGDFNGLRTAASGDVIDALLEKGANPDG